MPRDPSGNYTLPAGNPVIAGTVILDSWANPTMADVAVEITNSLDRQGRGGMLAPFQNTNGSVLAPGITFTSEPSTGLYLSGTKDMRQTITGIDTTRWIDATAQDEGQQKPFLIFNGLVFEAPVTPSFDGALSAGSLDVTVGPSSFVGGVTMDAATILGTLNVDSIDSTLSLISAKPVTVPSHTTANLPDPTAILSGSLARDSSLNRLVMSQGGAWTLVPPSDPADVLILDTEIKTGAFAAIAGAYYMLDTSGGSFDIALPPSPAIQARVGYIDFGRSFSAENAVWTAAENIESSSEDYEMDLQGASGVLEYLTVAKGWLDRGGMA